MANALCNQRRAWANSGQLWGENFFVLATNYSRFVEKWNTYMGLHYRTDIRKAVKDTDDTVILSQLLYWEARKSIMRNNRLWIIKNYSDLENETGIPASTIRKCIKKLSTDRSGTPDKLPKLVDYQVGWFAGKKQLFFAVNTEALATVLNEQSDKEAQSAPVGHMVSIPSVPDGRLVNAPVGHTITDTTKRKTTKKQKERNPASADLLSFSEDNSPIETSDLTGQDIPDKKEPCPISLKEAVQEVWGVNARTGSILTQLCGNAKKKGSRKEYVLSGTEGSLRLMDTAQEVLAFKAFWDDLPNTPDAVPESAEILYERIQQFREHTDYSIYLEKGGYYIQYLIHQKGESEHSEPAPSTAPPADVPVNEEFLARRDRLYAQFKR